MIFNVVVLEFYCVLDSGVFVRCVFVLYVCYLILMSVCFIVNGCEDEVIEFLCVLLVVFFEKIFVVF